MEYDVYRLPILLLVLQHADPTGVKQYSIKHKFILSMQPYKV